jgi:hypothetical protein
MTSRELVAPRVLATGTASIATATTTNISFGAPTDVKLAPGANYKPNDRLVVVITASTAGTTDSTSFDVQDAPDNAGSIGTPAAALTTTLAAAATGNQYLAIGVRPQPGRPWIRVRTTRASGTTDTLVVRAVLLAIPHNL